MTQPLKKSEELYHICGDVADPSGSGKRGVQSSMDLTKGALGHPTVVYEHAGQRYGSVTGRNCASAGVHLICPLCSIAERPHGLTVRQSQKQMEFRDGRLSVEPFGCTWETEPELRRAFGLATCPWRVAIQNNIAKDV